MKILQVLTSYEPAWAVGGSITATSNLCRALAKKGLEVTVYTTNADGTGGKVPVPVGKPIDLGGVEVWYFPYELGGRRAFYSRSLLKKLRENVRNFDLIQAAGIWQWICVEAAKIVRAENRPLVITPHSSLMKSSFYEIGSKWIKRNYWKFFGQKIINRATAVQFLCEGEREESREFCPSTPSFIVPNGIEVNKYSRNIEKRRALRKTLNLPDSALVLLFLGRVNPKKQIELVINSLPSLLRLRPDVYFIISGPVDDFDYLKMLKDLASRLKVESHLIWTGLIEHHLVQSYYSASDLMVLPSKAEGISMSLTEAMAASLPLLISNRVANYREIEADRAGLVTEPKTESVEKALVRICQEPALLDELSENARRSAEKRYDIEAVASLMIKAYEDIISGRQSPELNWQ
ncbi:MAG: glycosyltransferase [Candidatus Aminicenantes bacterium]|nr:glycosyltransferase [Candidatus Aminicenantes bacterium]